MDGIHQMDEVLPRAVLGIDAAVVLNGVGAAQSALTALRTNGMDGHEPDDVCTQPLQAVQVALQRAEGAFFGVVAHKDAVNHLMQQILIGMLCHDVYLLISETPEIHLP